MGAASLVTISGKVFTPERLRLQAHCTGPVARVLLEGLIGGGGGEDSALVFPLPRGAALVRSEISVSVRRMSLAVQLRESEDAEREEAEAGWVCERFKGETEPLLIMHLGKVGAKEKSHFILEMAAPVTTFGGYYELRLGYMPGNDESGKMPPDRSAEAVVESGGLLLEEPTSNQPIQVEQLPTSDYHVISKEGAEPGEFVLRYRLGAAEMPKTWLRSNGQHFLFGLFGPTSLPASPQRRDLVFIIDGSENVRGGVYDLVVDGIVRILKELKGDDRFALVTIGRDVDGYRGGEFCEIDEVEAACEWLPTVKPFGRADLLPLLERVQTLPVKEGRQICVFLLAGGHMGNEPSILKSLEFDQADRRFYAVGLGPNANVAFLRRLAMVTRGGYEAAPSGNCYAALHNLLGQTRALITDIALETPDGKELDSDDLSPAIIGCLTPNSTVDCLGVGAPANLDLRSLDETGVKFVSSVYSEETPNPSLGAVWASLKVSELHDSIDLATGVRKEAHRHRIAELALEFGFSVRLRFRWRASTTRTSFSLRSIPPSGKSPRFGKRRPKMALPAVPPPLLLASPLPLNEIGVPAWLLKGVPGASSSNTRRR